GVLLPQADGGEDADGRDPRQRRGAARLDRVVRQGGDQAEPAARAEPLDPEEPHPLPVQRRGAARARPPAPPGPVGGRVRSRGILTGPRRQAVMASVLALTQGDPAGIGPEILLKLLSGSSAAGWIPLVIAERAALEALRPVLPNAPWDRLQYLSGLPTREQLSGLGETIAVLDPVRDERREIAFGHSQAADAAGALAALDAGIGLARTGVADAIVTAPVAKSSIAKHVRSDFRGHTDYLAEACGLERYGRDYLMAFLAPELQVALLTVHVPLREAIE